MQAAGCRVGPRLAGLADERHRKCLPRVEPRQASARPVRGRVLPRAPQAISRQAGQTLGASPDRRSARAPRPAQAIRRVGARLKSTAALSYCRRVSSGAVSWNRPMDTAVKLRTRPLKPGFGAEILDVDLKRADESTIQSVVS